MTRDPDFKGYIHDVGGPTADFRQPACKKQLSRGACHEPAVPVPHALQESRLPTTRTISRLLRKLRATARRQEGLYPQRYPL